ncbi:hypothetical protein WKI45_22670 [Delftia tsuruhatensis]
MKNARTGYMNFFDVKKCGLYLYGDGDGAVSKGVGLADTLRLLANWVKDLEFEETIPWDPKKSPESLHDCYCHDLYANDDNGDYVLVLWKSDGESSGNLWGRAKKSQFGNLSAVERKDNGKKNMIWGRPCYYWFLPSENVVISIKFDNSVCDTALMQEWVERAIIHRIKHENKSKQPTPSGQIRFQFNDSPDDAKFVYDFKVRIKSVDTSNAEFSKLASSVTHIVKRHTIRIPNIRSDRAGWLALIGDKIVQPKDNATSREVEVRIEARPTAEQLREIVENFAKENRKKGDWDNVGFTVDKQIVWADSYRLHDHIIFDSDTVGVLGAFDVYEQLLPQRAKIVNMIKNSTEKLKKAA